MFVERGKIVKSTVHFRSSDTRGEEGKGIYEAVFVVSGLLFLSRICYFLGSRKGTEAPRDLEQKTSWRKVERNQR